MSALSSPLFENHISRVVFLLRPRLDMEALGIKKWFYKKTCTKTHVVKIVQLLLDCSLAFM